MLRSIALAFDAQRERRLRKVLSGLYFLLE